MSQHSASTQVPPRWPARTWIALLICSGVILLDGLDISMITVAIPQIQHELGMTAAVAQWLAGAYILAFGSILLLGGRCADLFGRRRVLVVAMTVFAVVSLLGALATDPVLLIVSRFLKGAAAAFTAPAAMSLLTTTFPEGPHRNRAFGIFNVFEASGYSSGLLVGGLLATIDWRATFVLPIPIAVLLVFAAIRYLPPDPPRTERERLDVGGAVTLLGGMLLFVFTVSSAADAGWTSTRTIGGLVVAAALLTAFGMIERTVRRPLVRLGIFRNRALATANVSAALLYGGAMGFQFLLALYLQNVNGWQPWQMAFVLLPAGLMVVLIGPKLGALLSRYGVGRVLLTGLAAFIPAYALLLRLGPEPDLWTVLLPASVLWGLGFALSISALMVAGTSGVADEEQGLAAGLLNSSLQVGGASGLAVVTAAIAPGTEPGMFPPGVWVILAFAVLTLVAQVFRRSR
ncbi:putative MFS family arabinose efflux permease [Kribbella amoyensis]|uniref:Putative MFS family arabinose efflux permease n=1 Tax=Kribbella amoyensis TaxID=996641 RepID=A0A561B3J0_9ACTN|nr:MFS transporter [Kribbella amoyensis]TWD73417.1 putative MFS family arabinose efflux permease [Kribbella amoyensis]